MTDFTDIVVRLQQTGRVSAEMRRDAINEIERLRVSLADEHEMHHAMADLASEHFKEVVRLRKELAEACNERDCK